MSHWQTAAVSKILFCYLHKQRSQVLWQFLQLRGHKSHGKQRDTCTHKYASMCGWLSIPCVCVCVRVQVSVSVNACCFVAKQKLSHKYFPSFGLEIYQRYPPWDTHIHTHQTARMQLYIWHTYSYKYAISIYLHTQFLFKANKNEKEIFMKCHENCGNLSPVGEHNAAKTVSSHIYSQCILVLSKSNL